jgi:N-acetylmuramoyl-L-alanine amidase
MKKILSCAAIAAVVCFASCKKANIKENESNIEQLTGDKQLLTVNFSNYAFESSRGTSIENEKLLNNSTGQAESKVIELNNFATAAPFIYVYGVVNGQNIENENVRLQFSGSADGKQWQEYIDVNPNEDADATPSRMVFGNVELNANTKYIKFRINFFNSKASLTNAEIFVLNPGVTSAEQQAEINAASARITQEVAIMNGEANVSNAATNPALCAKPGFTSRSTWGARAPRSTSGTSTVNFLVIHHEVGSNSSTDWAARVRAVQNLHMDTNGWSDIGYNYLVDPNGVAYEGRSGGENIIGAHLCGKNTNTMGVCMLGTYTSVLPTNNAQYTLKRIMAWKTVQRGLDPLGTGYHVDRTIFRISGHQSSCSTSCPGTALFNFLGTLRTDINTNFVTKCR